MKLSPRILKWAMNIWPPFLGAGIRVRTIAADFRAAEVELRLGFLNRNYVGVHFGGSVYAMTDPFYMLLIMHCLGRDYIVWDKHGSIDYRKPGRGRLSARFTVDEVLLAQIRAHTEKGDKYLPVLTVDVCDAEGDVVAHVSKTLYIRKKVRA